MADDITEQLEQFAKRLSLEEETKEQLEKQKELLRSQIDFANDLNDAVELNQKARENQLKLTKLDLQEQQNILNNLLAQKKAGQELTENQKAEIQAAIDKKKELQKQLGILKEQNDAVEGFSGKLTNAFQKYTGITGQAETLLGHSFKLAASGASFSEGLGEALKNIKDMATPTNIMVAAIDTVVQSTVALAVAQEAALSNFNKVTGAAGKYNDQIIDLERNNGRFRITTEDASQAVQELYTGMAGFTSLSKTEQNTLMQTTAVLEKFGVDAQTSAANIDIATRALGMNAMEAERMQRELLNTAQVLEVSPQLLAKGFAEAAPQLAAQGDKMVDVFKEMSAQAKATGLSVNDLLGVVSKFDTFEGAADAAGKLNAVLGGDLVNSVDLLMATEDERIKMLQDTITNSGKAWNEMRKYEQQAVAAAAGIDDMNKAARLFNPNMVGMTDAEKEHAKTLEELEKQMPAVTNMFDDLKFIVTKLAISIAPLVKWTKMFVTWVLKANDTVQEWVGIGFMPLITIFGLVGFAGYKLIVMIKKLGGAAQETGKSIGEGIGEGVKNAAKGVAEGMKALGSGFAGALKAAASGVQAFGTAATKAAPGLLAFGAAILLIGAGIGIAAFGVSYLADSFAKLNIAQIIGLNIALVIMGATIVILALVMAKLAPVLVVGGAALAIFGAAILLVGAGVALAAFGMSLLVNSFKGLDPVAMLQNAQAMVIFTTALFGFVAIGPAAVGVALAAAGAFWLLNLAVGNVATKMTDFNQSLANVNFEAVVSGYARIAQEINNIVDSIEELPLTKAMTFSYLVGATPALATGTPTGAATAGAERSVDRIAVATEKSAAANVSTAGTAPGATPQVVVRPNIKLFLDGKEVGKALDREIRTRASDVVNVKVENSAGRGPAKVEYSS